jgi:outer membrane protein assembly factor BamE (lipoprotein component of BamABCDE complex)
MKTMRTLPAALALLILAGCATTFKPWNLSNVREGMEREQVTQLLGEPDYTIDKDGAEYLYYSFREEMAPAGEAALDTSEQIERRADALDRTLKEHKYEVMLVDGKLVNYKELER